MTRALVIAGVDGSADSELVIRRASDYATMLAADLRIVTAWNEMVYQDAVVGFHPDVIARQLGGDAAHAVFGPVIPPWATVVTRPGPAGPALVAEAARADLLVVGTRGHSAVGGMLLGSVSTYCAEHSNCPVLVVPTRQYGATTDAHVDAEAQA